ncbi:FG-GAP-like repeat-containing protein [Streptomyces spongiae]|uniref:Integrin-like protein n=1 Tax=Streptomyces spongiae TaxID=565072 RepID=A0A5N8XYE1_9ACTN|nr:FG-GAP-like repeat-containing protein [Streptomyces spongiae]MPY63725.1 integrin-like protein [Streptomyces spongiae]
MRLRTITTLTALVAAGVAPLTLPTPASAAPAKYADDFNGDGYRDLAVGMPEKTIDGKKRAGAVLVTFGSSAGLTSKKVYITQNSSGIPGSAETEDTFGTDLSSGDLDGDGYADLLVTSEAESIGDLSARGTVTVLWGGTTPFRSGTVLPAGLSYDDQFFGNDTVVGDFVGDASPDIVVADLASLWLYEGGFGRTSVPSPSFVSTRGDGSIGIAQLAAGDFTGKGKDELAVTGPAATVIYTAGGASEPEPSDFFNRAELAGGNTVTAGDLNGDGRDDLAIGLSNSRLYDNGLNDRSGGAGYVMVHYGAADRAGGLNPQRHTYHQGSSGIPGGNEPEDEFGAALSIADVTGDGRAELAIGVPYESLDGARRGGDVLLLRGGSNGLTTTGAKRFSQNSPGVPGTAENNDVFGSRVRLADFNGNGRADLAVSAPYENPYRNAGSGAVWQLHGTSTGLTGNSADVFGPSDYGIARGSVLGDALND